MSACAVSLIVLSLFAATPQEADAMKNIKINPMQIASVQPKKWVFEPRIRRDARGNVTHNVIMQKLNEEGTHFGMGTEVQQANLWAEEQNKKKKWAEDRFTVSLSNGERYDLVREKQAEFEALATYCSN